MKRRKESNNYSIVSNIAELQRSSSQWADEYFSRIIFIDDSPFWFEGWRGLGSLEPSLHRTGLKTSSWLSRCLRGAEWFFVAAGSSPRYAAKSRAFPIKGTLPFFSRPRGLAFFPRPVSSLEVTRHDVRRHLRIRAAGMSVMFLSPWSKLRHSFRISHSVFPCISATVCESVNIVRYNAKNNVKWVYREMNYANKLFYI